VSTELDLRTYIRPGDLVVWGQACAEPTTLTEMLVRQSAQLGGVRCFVGIPADSSVTVGVDDSLTVSSYCGSGTNAALHAEGRLEIVRSHYSELPDALSTGRVAADVVMVQVSPPDPWGRHSLGLADDYFSAALDTARVVLAEINSQVPFTLGARTLTAADMTAAIHTSRRPAQMPTPDVDAQTRAVAARVAGLIQDGSTLQFGIGALPEAVLAELAGHRDLGIHSGIINDGAMRLIRSGAANGSRKTHDRGVAIGGLLGGTDELFRFAHRNRALQLRSTRYTHDRKILASSHQLAAINSAIEVDLTGQVNAETVGSRYVGALGGAVDFLSGAARSWGGLPIVALPSTAKGRSRIVGQLSGPVSTPREIPIFVVTEHGVADLRTTSREQRVERMLAVADPAHRSTLETAAHEMLATT
jgi:acetyl-CoA hydrolase